MLFLVQAFSSLAWVLHHSPINLRLQHSMFSVWRAPLFCLNLKVQDLTSFILSCINLSWPFFAVSFERKPKWTALVDMCWYLVLLFSLKLVEFMVIWHLFCLLPCSHVRGQPLKVATSCEHSLYLAAALLRFSAHFIFWSHFTDILLDASWFIQGTGLPKHFSLQHTVSG